MNITVNGATVSCPEGSTLVDLANQLELSPEKMVAELNRTIIPAALFGETKLAEGDVLELLQFVGGG